MRFAQRISHMKTAASFDAMVRARALEAAGRRIVHLGIGEPDFDTPRPVREAAAAALEAGDTHYGPPAGLPEFRARIAEVWGRERAIPCTADNVVVTPGAKPILFYAMLALLEPGDEVLFPSPGFPAYRAIADLVGARIVPVPLDPARGFDVDLAALEARVSPRSRMFVLNSPHNPTGAVTPRATLEAIAALAARHDLVVLADEIYGRMTYGAEHISIASLPGMAERTVVLDGFSKTYAMTGWRLGFGIMPAALAGKMAALMNHSVSCTATFVQRAGLAALAGPLPEVDAMLAEFARRREVVLAGLRGIARLSCIAPQGAFYAFPDIRGTGFAARELADRLLEEAGVVVLPGDSFGPEGEGFLRLSFANSVEELTLGLARIGEFLAEHSASGTSAR